MNKNSVCVLVIAQTQGATTYSDPAQAASILDPDERYIALSFRDDLKGVVQYAPSRSEYDVEAMKQQRVDANAAVLSLVKSWQGKEEGHRSSGRLQRLTD